MNIVINGGTKGIGKAIVLKLAENSSNKLVVTGRNADSLKKLESDHKNVRVKAFDISATGNIAEYFSFVSKEMGSVDVLINCAGLLIAKPFLEYCDDEARKVMETNFFGPAALIRSLAPLMKQGTHIVNISSMGGFQGSSKYRGLSYYSASKAAIACLTECLAEELKERGIRVNCLALGSVQTEMLDEAFPGYKAPVTAAEMGEYIANFAINGHKVFNGKIIPVALTNP